MFRGSRRKRDGLKPADAVPSTDLGPSAGLDQPLAELLDDVRDLRLTLAADLTAAAAAAELGAERIAADIVDGDRSELAAFTRRAIARLRDLDETDAVPVAPVAVEPAPVAAGGRGQWRRRALITLPAVPLAGALAMSAAAAMGVLPGQHPARSTPAVAEPAAPVSSTFERFATVVAGDPSASQVVAAASALHEQIAAMIATAPEDPSGVREVAQLLQMEQALLLRKLPPGSSIVLAQSRRLAARLLSVTAAPSAAPMPTSTHNSSPKPTTTASATPKPTATHTAKSSPTPSSSPSASPTSTDSSPHLPSLGN